MKWRTWWLPMAVLIMSLAACSTEQKPPATQPLDSVSADTLPAHSPKNVQKIPLDSSAYDILHNIEMVEYCMPYPKQVFVEDATLAEYRGQHVFVSADDKMKLTFSGNPTELSEDSLYNDYVRFVRAKGKAAQGWWTHRPGYMRFGWLEDGLTNSVTKWYRPSEMETITMHFQYPEAASEEVDPWHQTMIDASTACE